MSYIIVTAANDKYFRLCLRMLSSLNTDVRSSFSVGVIDCGLTNPQIDDLRSSGASVVSARWDLQQAIEGRLISSALPMTVRPFIPRYFPGYETYIWLDSDTVILSNESIEKLATAARLGQVAISPELHRSYSNTRLTRDEYETVNGKAYCDCFGEVVARKMIRHPVNNCGVFSAMADSLIWAVWSTQMERGAFRSLNMIDQASLNFSIYECGIREVRLPATYNWIFHLSEPMWSDDCSAIVEPDFPFDDVKILHFTLDTKWRDAIELTTVETLARKPVIL